MGQLAWGECNHYASNSLIQNTNNPHSFCLSLQLTPNNVVQTQSFHHPPCTTLRRCFPRSTECFLHRTSSRVRSGGRCCVQDTEHPNSFHSTGLLKTNGGQFQYSQHYQCCFYIQPSGCRQRQRGSQWWAIYFKLLERRLWKFKRGLHQLHHGHGNYCGPSPGIFPTQLMLLHVVYLLPYMLQAPFQMQSVQMHSKRRPRVQLLWKNCPCCCVVAL